MHPCVLVRDAVLAAAIDELADEPPQPGDRFQVAGP
jgi:hypothetical protein